MNTVNGGGQDTAEGRSHLLEDEIFAHDASRSDSRQAIASRTESSAAELFSGQFASALNSFASPVKEPFSGTQVDENLWLPELATQNVLYERKARDSTAEITET